MEFTHFMILIALWCGQSASNKVVDDCRAKAFQCYQWKVKSFTEIMGREYDAVQCISKIKLGNK